ncbi:hypothetical protein [Paenibacillus marinisediminis]
MRKIAVLFVLMSVIFAGCGSSNKADEKLAVDYINSFMNATDVEAKKKFVEENVHPDIKPLFQLGQSNVLEESEMLKDPKVIESIDYEEKGKKGTLVLINGSVNGEQNEIIVLILEGKLGFAFNSNVDNEALKKTYDEMRSEFKAKPLK